MPSAKITLPNGANITIQGTKEEIQELLAFYSESDPKLVQKKSSISKTKEITKPSKAEVDLNEIINLVKTEEIAEAIERNILDKASQVDRTLLPLFIVHEYLNEKYGLTSGEINKITTDLGIPIATPNISKVLSSSASRFVIADKVRKRGLPVRYKLSRRGVAYLKSVIEKH